jgi:hypothetical protein
MMTLPLSAVIQNYIKTARCCDDKLVACFESVSRSPCSSRHVVEIKNTFDIKGDVPIVFDKGQVSAGIRDFRQVYVSAIL